MRVDIIGMKRLIQRRKGAAITVNNKSFIINFSVNMNKVVFRKKYVTPLKRQHWQLQLNLPCNALEKKRTMTGKWQVKKYIIECNTGGTPKGKNTKK